MSINNKRFCGEIRKYLIETTFIYIYTSSLIGDAFLMSTNIICFRGDIRKYLPDTSIYLPLC